MRGRDGRRGQGGRLSGEEGSGAAAADARRLPTPAAPSAPPGADRCSHRSISLPRQPPSSRIPASPTLHSAFPPHRWAPPGRSPAGRLRALRGAGGGAASPPGTTSATAIFCRIRLGWCRLPSAVGAPSPSGSRQSQERWQGSHIPATGSGHGAAEQPRSSSIPSAVPSQPGGSLNAPSPPAPVPSQSPARSRSIHTPSSPVPLRTSCPPVPPTPPPASPGRPATVAPLSREG